MCAEIIQTTCIEWEISSVVKEYLETENVRDNSEYFTSDLSDEDCAVLSDVLTDVYSKFEDIEEMLDFSEWDNQCLDLEDNPTLQQVLTSITEEVCTLKETVANIDSICEIFEQDITECDGLNFSCLTTDACDNPITITTFSSWVQTITDKVCDLETRLVALEA